MSGKREFMLDYLDDLKQAVNSIDLQVVEEMLGILAQCREQGRFIWVIGNGGSALTASHFAVDLGKGASYGRERRFPVIALTESLGTITAYGNDTSYNHIFLEQLKNVVRPGDVLVALSGSGNSENVIQALEYCRENGVITLGLTGKTGGRLAQMCDYVFQADTDHMGRIEDLHMIVVHLITYYFMEKDSGKQ
ncbi:MAG TPA: SIS domain-containing protein [Bacillota bacterium]|jgi:D-sedoheptulose 7-phosphate isomerase|nr:SIS domain-containing protein [Bacillota bacterium]